MSDDDKRKDGGRTGGTGGASGSTGAGWGGTADPPDAAPGVAPSEFMATG